MSVDLGSKFKETIENVYAATDEEKKLQKDFLLRIQQGALTKAEDPIDHFGVFFWPYNQKTKQVFIVHHKKSGKWLAPGGHIEKGELPIDTVVREMQEELGFRPKRLTLVPFMISITPVVYLYGYQCKIHYDIWFGISTSGGEFTVDPKEFHTTRWIDVVKVKEIFIDNANHMKALSKLQRIF